MNMDIDLVIAGYLFHRDKVLLIHHAKSGMWLPVGGHIEENETPDEAVRREFKEEVGLEVEPLGKKDLVKDENTKENLTQPFHVNLHNVGDHDHCCFYYVCKPVGEVNVDMNKDEVQDYEWFSREEIESDDRISDTGKDIALEAFRCRDSLP